jgi:hypothetical protein
VPAGIESRNTIGTPKSGAPRFEPVVFVVDTLYVSVLPVVVGVFGGRPSSFVKPSAGPKPMLLSGLERPKSALNFSLSKPDAAS